MKKLITILGAGLLAFGMFTSCGAKDVNLSWSDEATSYIYDCDVTAGTITEIDDPSAWVPAGTTPTSTTTVDYTFNYATVSWSDGYAGNNASKNERNRKIYTITLSYDWVETVTDNATSYVLSKTYSRDIPGWVPQTFNIYKYDDKYYINPGADNQAEVTIDGDIEDDEFTFSVDDYTISYVDDWKADGSTNYYKGDNEAVQRAVRTGTSYSDITVVRK